MHDTSCYIKVSQNVSLEKFFKHSQITYFQHENLITKQDDANKQEKMHLATKEEKPTKK